MRSSPELVPEAIKVEAFTSGDQSLDVSGPPNRKCQRSGLWTTGQNHRAEVQAERRSWPHNSINTHMSTPAPWPTNRYGTSWRTITIWFEWSDEAILWEAIENLDPLKITARTRPIVIVGFEGDVWMPVSDLVRIIRDGNDSGIVVDPRSDLPPTLARIRADFDDDPWISVLGLARLDLADASTYQALLAALEDRWAENWFEMPLIEFQGLRP
jgi:hypothetical protein